MKATVSLIRCLLLGKVYEGTPSVYLTAPSDESLKGCIGCVANQNNELCHALPTCYDETSSTDLIFKEIPNV